MSAAAVSFADRVAKRLGIDPGGLAGAGPAGAATLADVLKKAGRRAPAAARSSPGGFIGGAEEGGDESGGERHRLEAVCDAAPLGRTCEAFAAVTPEPPDVFALVGRLCGAALRDVPALSRCPVRAAGGGPGPALEFVVHAPAAREPSSFPGDAPESEEDEAGGPVVLTVGEAAGAVHLELEFDAGTVSAAAGEAFLERLRILCRDPRRALL